MIALYFIGGMVLFFLLVILIMPTDFNMEREVSINKNKEAVFSYLRSLKNQDTWSVWNMKDPNMKQVFTGVDGTVGFVSAWESTNKNVGIGEQEIKKIIDGEKIELEMRFQKPMKATNNAWFTVKSLSDNQTQVIWGFSGKMKRPMNFIFPIMKGMIIKDFDQGLANLKKNLEKE